MIGGPPSGRREEERLVPVRSESELRPGMLVVVRPCMHGDGRHRIMLGRRHPPMEHRHAVPGRGLVECSGCWAVLDESPRCRDNPDLMKTIRFVSTIAEGRLFRVEDGTDRDTQETQGAEDEALMRVRGRGQTRKREDVR